MATSTNPFAFQQGVEIPGAVGQEQPLVDEERLAELIGQEMQDTPSPYTLADDPMGQYAQAPTPSSVNPFGGIGGGMPGQAELSRMNSLNSLYDRNYKKTQSDSPAEAGYRDMTQFWNPLEAEQMQEVRARNTPSMLNPETGWEPVGPFNFQGDTGMPQAQAPQGMNYADQYAVRKPRVLGGSDKPQQRNGGRI